MYFNQVLKRWVLRNDRGHSACCWPGAASHLSSVSERPQALKAENFMIIETKNQNVRDVAWKMTRPQQTDIFV